MSTEAFYSVEWLPKDHPFNCWGQYVLTPSKWRARLYHLELRLSKRGSRTRIREV